MMRCAANVLTTHGDLIPCVMGDAHADSHLAIDGEGNLFRWDDPVEVAR
jgi:hypothetical protein